MKLISRRMQVMEALHHQGEEALRQAGAEAVAQVIRCMASGYGSPIRETGALMGDVTAQVEGLTLQVGNRLDYAVLVHEGSHRRGGRAYLRDGIIRACPGMMEGIRKGLGG